MFPIEFYVELNSIVILDFFPKLEGNQLKKYSYNITI